MKKILLATVAILFGAGIAGSQYPALWQYVPSGIQAVIPGALKPAAITTEVAANKDAPAGEKSGPAPKPAAGGGRAIPVATAQVKKETVPYMVDAIGTIQPIATVTLRSRVDSQIEDVLFKDGAAVKAGDVLFRLDSRMIEAQLKQAEGTLDKDRALLDVAKKTLKRGEDLATRNFATLQRLDENVGQVTSLIGAVKADEAQVENLRTQLSFYTIRSPITGRAGLANLKTGNIAQSAAAAVALTTINQMSPIYVSFSVPQKYFGELRDAIERNDSFVEATPLGMTKTVKGKLALIENAIDNNTGTIGVRATFENPDDLLWPGAICNLKIVMKQVPDMVVVPREAVQQSQKGNFVFLVVDGAAKMQPVTLGANVGNLTIIASGLKGGETVITDGQLLVVEGAKVAPKTPASSALPLTTPTGTL